MFLISVSFRPTRSKGNREKPGVVFYRVTRYGSGEPKIERNVNSDIHGYEEGIIQTERERIITQIRLLYCIIEYREDSKEPYTIDDVLNDFRKALAGDDTMAEDIVKSKTAFPLRRDIVSICREFRGAFTFVFSDHNKNAESLFDYIFNLKQNLKTEQRHSLANSFASLQSSLRDFAASDDVRFEDINARFIHSYSDWLKQKGVIVSTQAFYLRTLRSVLYKAQSDGFIEVTQDCFEGVDTRVYKSSESKNKILSRDLLLKIEKLDLSTNQPLALARDMFMFGFYCGGMELVDIANLTLKNVKNDKLIFRRRSKGLEKMVLLGEQAMNILKKYRRSGQKHIFPLIDEAGDITFGALSNNVRLNLLAVGMLVGAPSLTFSMNISTYKSLISSVNLPELLLSQSNAS